MVRSSASKTASACAETPTPSAAIVLAIACMVWGRFERVFRTEFERVEDGLRDSERGDLLCHRLHVLLAWRQLRAVRRAWRRKAAHLVGLGLLLAQALLAWRRKKAHLVGLGLTLQQLAHVHLLHFGPFVAGCCLC